MTEKYVVEVEKLDKKGSGQVVVWRENEHGNKKKLTLVIPESLPGESGSHRRKTTFEMDESTNQGNHRGTSGTENTAMPAFFFMWRLCLATLDLRRPTEA